MHPSPERRGVFFVGANAHIGPNRHGGRVDVGIDPYIFADQAFIHPGWDFCRYGFNGASTNSPLRPLI